MFLRPKYLNHTHCMKRILKCDLNNSEEKLGTLMVLLSALFLVLTFLAAEKDTNIDIANADCLICNFLRAVSP